MRAAAKGALLVAVSAASFGCVGILGKQAIARSSIETVLAARWAIGGASLLLLATATRGSVVVARSRVGGLVLLGVGLTATSGLFFLALDRLDSGIASVLLFTNPILVAMAARPIFGERLGKPGLVALGLAVAGAGFVAYAPGRVDAVGAALALAGAGTYAAYILGTRRFGEGLDPAVSAAWVMLCGSAIFLAVGAARETLAPPPRDALLPLAGLGLFGGAIAISTFLAGVPLVGASRAAILSTIEPATTVLVGAALLEERLSLVQAVGALAIATAAALVATRRAA